MPLGWTDRDEQYNELSREYNLLAAYNKFVFSGHAPFATKIARNWRKAITRKKLRKVFPIRSSKYRVLYNPYSKSYHKHKRKQTKKMIRPSHNATNFENYDYDTVSKLTRGVTRFSALRRGYVARQVRSAPKYRTVYNPYAKTHTKIKIGKPTHRLIYNPYSKTYSKHECRSPLCGCS